MKTRLMVSVLATVSGLAAAMGAASAVAQEVGKVISATPVLKRVTEPKSIAADGTLFVHVTTNAWMMELSLLEPELLRALNAKEGRAPVRKIRWLIRRG